MVIQGTIWFNNIDNYLKLGATLWYMYQKGSLCWCKFYTYHILNIDIVYKRIHIDLSRLGIEPKNPGNNAKGHKRISVVIVLMLFFIILYSVLIFLTAPMCTNRSATLRTADTKALQAINIIKTKTYMIRRYLVLTCPFWRPPSFSVVQECVR